MKYLFLVFILFLNLACTGNKSVYWCGDHACINNKEKEAYFKKTMIIEKRSINSTNYKNNSETNKIIEQAKINEKERISSEKKLLKEEKLNRKKQIKNEKEFAKKSKNEQKKLLKEEKKLAKIAKKKKKKQIKNKKKIVKENNLDVKNIDKDFENIVKKIIEKSSIKGYPDINNLPE